MSISALPTWPYWPGGCAMMKVLAFVAGDVAIVMARPVATAALPWSLYPATGTESRQPHLTRSHVFVWSYVAIFVAPRHDALTMVALTPL